MKPFSLDTVLKHRKRLLDLARGRFAEAQAEYAAIKEQVERCQTDRTGLIDRLTELQMAGIEITEYIRYTNRIDSLTSELQRLKIRLQKKHDAVVRERRHLLQKSKEHRVLENLKERQNDEWHAYLEKKEAKQLDEIAVIFRGP